VLRAFSGWGLKRSKHRHGTTAAANLLHCRTVLMGERLLFISSPNAPVSANAVGLRGEKFHCDVTEGWRVMSLSTGV